MKWTWSDGSTKFYKWEVAFLGISDLVYFFTKVMMPIKTYLHAQGIAAFIYNDNCLILGSSKTECDFNLNIARETWQKAGWIENRQKAMSPTQIGVFLGLTINLKEQKFYFPTTKIARVIKMIDYVVSHRSLHIKEVAKLYGLILSGLLAFGPIIHLLCRDGYQCLSSASSWDCEVDPSPIVKELLFLKTELALLNGHPMLREELQMPSNVKFLSSDASSTGFAVVVLTCSGNLSHKHHTGVCGEKISAKIFTPKERLLSSTHRELLALHTFYVSCSHLVVGKAIIHFTDNVAVAYIMQKGSNKSNLQEMALDIYKACKEHDIRL